MTTIKEMRLARSLDTMVNEVNNNPDHIARSKAKAEQTKAKLVESLKREAMQAIAEEAKANAHKAEAKKQKAKEQASIDLNGIMTITFLLGSLWGYVCHALMF